MRAVAVGFATALVVMAGSSVFAQNAPQGAAAEGVTNTRLLDRPDIRISKLDILAKSTRSMHSHPDMLYHVTVPLTGALEMHVQGKPNEILEPLHADYMVGGTMHGFSNTSDKTVTLLEIFVLKPPAKSAAIDPAQAVAVALAGLAQTPAR